MSLERPRAARSSAARCRRLTGKSTVRGLAWASNHDALGESQKAPRVPARVSNSYRVHLCAANISKALGEAAGRRLSEGGDDESTSVQLFFQTAPTAVAAWASGGAGPDATEYHMFQSGPGTSLSVGVVGSSSFDTDGSLTAYEWTLPGMPVWVYEAGALGFGVAGLWRSSSSDTTLEIDAGCSRLASTRPIIFVDEASAGSSTEMIKALLAAGAGIYGLHSSVDCVQGPATPCDCKNLVKLRVGEGYPADWVEACRVRVRGTQPRKGDGVARYGVATTCENYNNHKKNKKNKKNKNNNSNKNNNNKNNNNNHNKKKKMNENKN